MAGSEIHFSYEGIGDNVLRADFMVAEMGRRASRVLAECIATAPVYEGTEEDPHRGRYKASFSMRTTDHGGSKGNRAAGIVENSAPEARWVEVGNSRQEAHHTMRNALRAAGD